MAKACVICGGEEASGEQLLEAPCQRHWVCTDDVATFFERATESESLYPPKCCGQIFLLDLYEAYVPFDIQWAFQAKEIGEYSVLAKYRIYCANPTCSKFINPSAHVKEPTTNITYAICQDDACGKLTCTSCKTLLDGVEGHTCEQNEDYKKFKQTATEKGFQECPTCASTVELAEACNHITCECGTEFCYICGHNWPGRHGCPHYGPAIYDEEGYNQEGYHRSTGLNREGRMYREEDGDDEEEDDEEDEVDNAVDHPAWQTLQHVEPGLRAQFAALPHEEREMFLVNLQIQLFEERGITFPAPGEEDGHDGDESEEDGSEDEDVAGQDGNADEERTVEIVGIDESAAGRRDTPMNATEEVDFETVDAAMTDAVQSIEEAGLIDEAAGTEMATATQFIEDLSAPEMGLGISPQLLSHANDLLIRNHAGHVEDGGSSVTSPDDNQPSTPNDLPALEAVEKDEERPAWKGPPGGWPDDEEL